MIGMLIALATTSANLEALAKTLETTTIASPALDSQILAALREPALTLDKITLPATPGKYTTSLDAALTLRPRGWTAGGYEQPVDTGLLCTANVAYFMAGAKPGIRIEAHAWGTVTCPLALQCVSRAWSYKLRNVGR